MTPEEFWNITDTIKLATEARADERLRALDTAPVDEVRRVTRAYRYFPKYYISDLGLLLNRLPWGRLRSVMGKILDDELGRGDPEQDHHRLYDKFLLSIGVTAAELEAPVVPECVASFEHLSSLILSRSPAFAVGLRGMGGECLCQLYLARMHVHLLENPWITARRDSIDWTFWDFHVGEPDVEHGRLVRDAINEMVTGEPGLVHEIKAGYDAANEVWEGFWRTLYGEAAAPRR